MFLNCLSEKETVFVIFEVIVFYGYVLLRYGLLFFILYHYTDLCCFKCFNEYLFNLSH